MNTCQCYTTPVITNDQAVRKAEGEFAFVRLARNSWDSLYRCKVCGQYWEVSSPGAGDVCCVESFLSKITNAEAEEKYGVAV